MTYTLALKRTDPFGRPELGSCFACGESITWEDPKVVHITLRDADPVPFHDDCFEHFRAGLNLFAAVVLTAGLPDLPN